jgi:hypothetical protein
MAKGPFLLSLLRPKGKEVGQGNFGTGFGAPMQQACISKRLSLHTLTMDFGGVLLHFRCHLQHRKHI